MYLVGILRTCWRAGLAGSSGNNKYSFLVKFLLMSFAKNNQERKNS